MKISIFIFGLSSTSALVNKNTQLHFEELSREEEFIPNTHDCTREMVKILKEEMLERDMAWTDDKEDMIKQLCSDLLYGVPPISAIFDE